MIFGQVVVGPPGSGKTTFCRGMCDFLNQSGRNAVVVNLDPANEGSSSHCAVDISELITVKDVMDEFGLGPNGAMMYCMEYLEKNLHLLFDLMDPFEKNDSYFLFDFPGQAELFTHHTAVRHLVRAFQKRSYQLVCVNLVDSHYCTEPSKFISVLVLCLHSMLQLNLPHVNVLSKIDLLQSYGPLEFNLDFYTEVKDLSYLTDRISPNADSLSPLEERFKNLNASLAEVVSDYGLVDFETLDITDKESVLRTLRRCDVANGCKFRGSGESPIGPP